MGQKICTWYILFFGIHQCIPVHTSTWTFSIIWYLISLISEGYMISVHTDLVWVYTFSSWFFCSLPRHSTCIKQNHTKAGLFTCPWQPGPGIFHCQEAVNGLALARVYPITLHSLAFCENIEKVCQQLVVWDKYQVCTWYQTVYTINIHVCTTMFSDNEVCTRVSRVCTCMYH